ncbi:MAG: T9SS type A sorting domain-containing protein [Bacteroidetes bacterium]|nr:MAG: T9SS type A sorting domain-containing protein [Bacteroidota bacterium]
MNLRLLLALSFCVFLGMPLWGQHGTGWREFLYKGNANYFDICRDVERYFELEVGTEAESGDGVEGEDEGSAYNQYQRWKWFWSTRVNPDGSFPDMDQMADMREFAGHSTAVQSRGAADDCGWTLISQSTCSGGYSGMGKAISIAFHPTDPNIYYVSGESGGVWKTTNAGTNYASISQGLPYNAASNLVVDHSNPDILYTSNGNFQSYGNIYNTGIYKSYDGGMTWEPTALSWSISQQVAVRRMLMSPQNPLILLVASSNGLWRTEDGGDSWTMVRSGNHMDLEYKPGDPSTVYTTQNGVISEIYKSVNGGQSWQQLSSFSLPNNRLNIAVSPADPEFIAVLSRLGSIHKIYTSDDGGASFTFRSEAPQNTEVLHASPFNPNILYCGFQNVFRSDDKGDTWNRISHWHGGTPDPVVHADQHYIDWQPGTPYIFFCNDGGVWRYDEPAQEWLELSNTLIITQFYRIAVAQTDENFMIGGTQDNGGRKRVAPGLWEATNGGDAMEVAIDYTDADIIYTTYINGQLYRSMDAWVNDQGYRISNNLPGQTPDHDLTGSWVTPYQLDPVNPKALVLGYADVYRTTNRGESWTQISNNLTGNANAKLDALAIAPSDPNTIYASNGATLYRTTNLGGNWSALSTPSSQAITSITVHPHNPAVLYITKAGFSIGNKVYRSDDSGATWVNISSTLPNVPTHTLYLDLAADSSFVLFVGNDLGVWYRTSTMSDWVGMNQNLPITYISDLELQRSSRKLRAGTYGRGIWEYDLHHLPARDFAICTDQTRAQVCLPDGFAATVSANAWQDTGGPLNLAIEGLPAGAVAGFSASELEPDGTVVLSVDFAPGTAEGEYPVTVLAVSGTDTARATIQLTLVSNDFSDLGLLEPENGAGAVSRWPLLRWDGVADANAYDLELGTSPSFDPGTLVGTYTNQQYDSLLWSQVLEEGRTYYWRVRPVNECGVGAWTAPFVFATSAKNCVSQEANDLPKPITPNGTPTVESKITVLSGGPISTVKVKNFQGNHTFFKDLEAYLVSPAGTEVLLFKERCGAFSGNFMLGFEDDAPQPFGCPPPANGNSFRPEGQLGILENEDAAGVWTLRVKDNVVSSGGQMTGFAIEFCSEKALNPPVIVQNLPLAVAAGNNAQITADLLRTEDADTPPVELVYTLMTVPQFGDLQRYWTGAMQPGDQFTQTDIDNGGIRYFDYGWGGSTDQFRFSVSDGAGGLAADTFVIAPLPLFTSEPDTKLHFSLMPNPARENVTLSLSAPLSGPAQLTLVNLAGQPLRSWTMDAGQETMVLELETLPYGIYLLQVQSARATGVRKLLVHGQ